MKFFCFLLLISTICLNAKDIYVEQHFIDATKNYPKVNPGLMKIISMAETSGNPQTLAFLAYPDQAQTANVLLGQEGVRYRVKAYDSKRYVFSVWPKNNSEASKVFAILRLSKIDSYDIGLMQVNSLNARRNGWDEMRLFTDLVYNVDKGAKILNDCITSNSHLEGAIECYNKGSHKQYSYSYYQRVFALAAK